MTDWEEKWQEYCTVLDSLAKERPLHNYLQKMEKRLKGIAHRSSQGTIADREAAFHSSIEYGQYCMELRESNEKVELLEARRDQLKAWFDLWRTIEATRREEARLAR